MIVSEKHVVYIRFVKDTTYDYYGVRTIPAGKEFVYEPPDRISNVTYYMCVAHGVHVEFKIGIDVVIVNKLVTTHETEME